MADTTTRGRLTENEFGQLVRGEVAKVKLTSGEEVELILADIGFPAMQKHVTRAAVAAQKAEVEKAKGDGSGNQAITPESTLSEAEKAARAKK